MATEKKVQTKAKASVKPIDENTMVEIELFRDSKDYKDDVFVAVNGESCVIARGRKVKIKKKFADVLENSMRQDVKTARLMDKKSDEFNAEAAARNI